MNRRQMLVLAALSVAAVGTGASQWVGTSDASTAADTPSPEPGPRNTVKVTRQDLTELHRFDASVSYGDQWKLTTGAQGTVTWRPDPGTLIRPGDVLIRIADRPVILALGEMPMYRTIEKVPGGAKAQLRGKDVAQLQEFLRSAGFDEQGKLPTDGVFDQITERAVKVWQYVYGLPVTGKVDSAQLVFSPTPLRIATVPRVGQPLDAVNVTATNARLTIKVDAADASLAAIGTDVEVELADGSRLRGRIDDATPPKDDGGDGGDGGDKWEATIIVDDLPADNDGDVKVNIVKVYAKDVLVVPVGALLAPADGGWALEVVEGATTRLVAVEIGNVAVEGMIDVKGEVSEGTEVVVPS